ncbi:MAG: PspC domain-containing protein [bacterium]
MKPEATASRKLTRSRKERMIGGVCGGMANYFRLDPTLVRLIWAFGTVVSHGLGLLAYIILLIVLPEEEFQREQET